MFRFLRIAFGFIFLCSGVNGWANPSESEKVKFAVEKYQLANGLTVLLHEDHSAPVVSFHQWYRVGSRNEKPGRTGLAHFFEHLMFKGTKKHPKGMFEQLVEGNGGRFNAFTSHDYTGYYMDFPSGRLDLVLDLESQRMRNLILDPKEIQSEREVVKEERRKRIENSVYGSLQEAMFSTVFKVHPYRWPVIGSMKDLEAASLQDLQDFYRVFYAPNNAVLVVSGDFSSSEAKRLIEKYYGHLPRQTLPEPLEVREPVQGGPRQTILTKDVQNVTFAVAFPSVGAGTPESYSLDLLANILGGGQSSRLYKRLVYQSQLASSVSANNYTPMNPGVFGVYVSMRPGQNVDKALDLVYAEIAKARTQLVSVAELEKAKNQVMTSWVNDLKTVSGKAHALAQNETIFGNYTQLFSDLDHYSAVTPESIRQAAEKFLTPQRRSVVQVVPRSAQQTEKQGE